MGKLYKICSVCGNDKIINYKTDNGKIICLNCVDNVDATEFKPVDLKNLFFEAGAIQKMGHRFIIEIPQKIVIKVLAMGKGLRKGGWKVQAQSLYKGG
ncbi:hypothetical protein LCGC14_0938220 [marine sediment metagenome]|uniref:Uncharacterized protein n=1 Tax=marine sediment metagenome TaxID=412755 RepID=A0A0F9R4H7_9ZZZZ